MTGFGVFVGRDEELGRFARAAEVVRLFFVYGPAGVGKTTFAIRATEQLAARVGARRIAHTCRPDDRLATVSASLGALPVVVCLDDVHRAAHTMLDEIVDLATRGHPVWICATSREALPVSPMQVDHLVLRLPGLSRSGARALWTSLVDLYGPAMLSFDEALRRSGGSPLLLKQAFAGQLDVAGQDPLEILRLGPVEREILRELASFRRPPTLARVIQDRSEPETRAAVERLARRFLIEPTSSERSRDARSGARGGASRRSAASPPSTAAVSTQRSRIPSPIPSDVLYHAVRCGDDARAIDVLRLHTGLDALIGPSTSVTDRELSVALEMLARRRPLDAPLNLLRARIVARRGDVVVARRVLAPLADSGDPSFDLEVGELDFYVGDLDSAQDWLRRAASDSRVDLVGRLRARVVLIELLKQQAAFDAADSVLGGGSTNLEATGAFGLGFRAFLQAFLRYGRGQLDAAAKASAEAAEGFARFMEGLRPSSSAAKFMAGMTSAQRSLAGLIQAAVGAPPEDAVEPEGFAHRSLIFRLHARIVNAETLLLRGHMSDAEAIARETVLDSETHGLVVLALSASAVWVRAMLALGRTEEALGSLDKRLHAAEDIGLGGVALRLRAALAAALVDHGEWQSAAATADGGGRAWRASQPGPAGRLVALSALAVALGASRTRAAPRSREVAEGHDRAEAALDRVEALLVLEQPAKANTAAAGLVQRAELAGWQYLACRARGLEAEAAFCVGDFGLARSAFAEVRDRANRAGYAALRARADVLGAALLRMAGSTQEAERLLTDTAWRAEAAGWRGLAVTAAAALAVLQGRGKPIGGPGTQLARRLGLLDPIVSRLHGGDHDLWLTERQEATAFAQGDWAFVDLAHGRVRINGRVTDLSNHPTLLSMLAALSAPPGRIVPADELVHKVWGLTYHALRHRSRLVMSIARLRELIGGSTIETRQSGYRLMLGECRVLDSVAT